MGEDLGTLDVDQFVKEAGMDQELDMSSGEVLTGVHLDLVTCLDQKKAFLSSLVTLAKGEAGAFSLDPEKIAAFPDAYLTFYHAGTALESCYHEHGQVSLAEALRRNVLNTLEAALRRCGLL